MSHSIPTSVFQVIHLVLYRRILKSGELKCKLNQAKQMNSISFPADMKNFIRASKPPKNTAILSKGIIIGRFP